MLTEFVLFFVSGFGLLFFMILTATCIFNAFDYSSWKKAFCTGVFLGACSLLFNYHALSFDGTPIFNLKFMLIILLAIFFDNYVLMVFAPVYLAGVYLSGFSFLFALGLVLVAFVIGLMRLPQKYASLLLFLTIIPIAFSEIPACGYTGNYAAELALTGAVGASTFFLIIAGSFFLLLNRNFMGAVFIRAYAKASLGRLNNVYTFRISRKRTRVILSGKCAEDFEFGETNLPYAEFCRKLEDSTDHKITPVNRKIEEGLFVTVGTGRQRYIEYACYPRLFGGCIGIIYDITEQIPRYELLSKASIKDYVTGFPAYPALKEGILQIARKADGILLFSSIEVFLDASDRSIYDIDFENLCYRYLASLLKEQFPDAGFFALKSGELFMAMPAEHTRAALGAASKLQKVLSGIYDIGQKSIVFHSLIGAYYTESMRIGSLFEVNEALKKIEFCRYMVRSQQNGNLYLFSQNQYQDYLGTQLMSDEPPQAEQDEKELVHSR